MKKENKVLEMGVFFIKLQSNIILFLSFVYIAEMAAVMADMMAFIIDYLTKISTNWLGI